AAGLRAAPDEHDPVLQQQVAEGHGPLPGVLAVPLEHRLDRTGHGHRVNRGQHGEALSPGKASGGREPPEVRHTNRSRRADWGGSGPPLAGVHLILYAARQLPAFSAGGGASPAGGASLPGTACAVTVATSPACSSALSG